MKRNFVLETASVKEALVLMSNISSDILFLLVVNNSNQLVGTLTDGDIRRGLISGFQLTDEVCTIMHRDFRYIKQSEFDVFYLRNLREQQILFVPILDENNHVVDVINLKTQKSFLPIDAVLMAGGKGERLRPLTEKTPKPLLKVGKKSIIDYNIDRLMKYGVRHFSVTVNYLKEQIEEHFSNPVNGIKVNTVREPKFLGTIGSIKFVEKFYNDTVLLMNSDIFTDIDYEDFYLHFKEHNADISIAAVPYTVSVPYGIFELDGRNVNGILEKPTYNYYANGGIYLFKRELLDLINKDTFFNATDFIELLLKEGYKVIRYPLNGTWIDIGNPQEYQKAQDLVKHLKSKF